MESTRPRPAQESLASPPWWPFWIAFAAALALRLLWPEIRPLHHDEGVNGWFLVRLLDGYRYEYDPERFHGPFLYFLGAPFTLLLGMSETVLRLPVALASSAMLLLLLPLRRRLGRAGVTAAAWLLAVSPSLVYYGRDLIHETYLVALTLALVAAASRWLEARAPRHLVLAALCSSLLFTVKETAPLTLAVLALAALAAWSTAGRPPVRAWLEEVPARTWWMVVLALAVPYVLLYTSLLTNPVGLLDSFRAYLPWTKKGFEGSGHEKPWDYFAHLLLRFEPVAMVGAALGSLVSARRQNPFGVFCAIWWLGQLAVYSAIPYKTPWLALSIVLPAALCAGALLGDLSRRRLPGAVRAGITVAGLLLVAWTASQAIVVSFVRYDDESLDLVYVQTRRELRDFMTWIEEAAGRSPKKNELVIHFYTNNRWPLPWYLRGYKVFYETEIPPQPEGAVLICDAAQEKELRSRLTGRPYVRHAFTLRKRVDLVVLVTPPAARRHGRRS